MKKLGRWCHFLVHPRVTRGRHLAFEQTNVSPLALRRGNIEKHAGKRWFYIERTPAWLKMSGVGITLNNVTKHFPSWTKPWSYDVSGRLRMCIPLASLNWYARKMARGVTKRSESISLWKNTNTNLWLKNAKKSGKTLLGDIKSPNLKKI